MITKQCSLADLSNYQPTQFQPVSLCKKSTGNQPRSYPHIGPPTGDGWFSWNQPSFQPCAGRYEGWNGVGFCKTNLHSNYRLWYTKVGTRLVFAKPTVGFPIWGLEVGWFRVDFLHKATKHGWTSPRGLYQIVHVTGRQDEKFLYNCFLIFKNKSYLIVRIRYHEMRTK